MTTVVAPITAGANDGYARPGGGFSTIDTGLLCGDITSSVYDYSSFMRFTGLALPNGATISSATLTVTDAGSGSGSTGGDTSTVKGEAADNPAAVTSLLDLSSRTRTSAAVTWSTVGWTIGGANTSPSLASVIQEIVNRPGWASGNALQLFWSDPAGWAGKTTAVIVWSYDGRPATPPTLTIDYGTAGESHSGTVSLSGTGTLTASTRPSPGQAATLAGSGTLVATGTAEHPPAAPALTAPAEAATVDGNVTLGWTPDGTELAYSIRRRRL